MTTDHTHPSDYAPGLSALVQDDCAPRGNEHCYKSHDQMNEIRAIVKGC